MPCGASASSGAGDSLCDSVATSAWLAIAMPVARSSTNVVDDVSIELCVMGDQTLSMLVCGATFSKYFVILCHKQNKTD